MKENSKLADLLNRFLTLSPQSSLERRYIQEYLESKGYHWEALEALPEEQVKELMIAASRHASLKLAEVEARKRFKDEISFED